MKKFLGVFIVLTFFFSTMAPAVMAQNSAVSPLPNKQKLQLDPVCMQNAVEKRDNAIIAAFDVKNTAIKTALETRKNALKTAWGITDRKSRQDAIRKTWADFRVAKAQAVKTYNGARKVAWQQFRTERKACGILGTADDKATEKEDNGI